MSNHMPEEAVRVCSGCAQIKPDTQFRRRYRDRPDRMNQCNSCHSARERARLARRRQQRRGVEIQKFASAICSTRDRQQRKLICDLGVQQFGGINKFLKTWHDTVRSMVSSGQRSPRLLKFCELIWEIQREEIEQLRQELRDMPEDELEALVRRHVAELIQDDPQLAVDAAERLGWRLTPKSVSS